MDYRAVITLDYDGPTDPNDRNRLYKAMEAAGWSYAQTSAMYIECRDLEPVLSGLEILARSLDVPGVLSACAITIQLVGPDRGAPGNTTSRNAYRTVMQRPLPSER